MAGGYSLDLRVRVMRDLEQGMSADVVALKYSVSTRTVFAWLRLKRETGDIKPRQGKTGPKRKLEPFRDAILAAIEQQPHITLEELRSRLDLPGCLQTLWNALHRWGIVLKKSHPRGRTATA